MQAGLPMFRSLRRPTWQRAGAYPNATSSPLDNTVRISREVTGGSIAALRGWAMRFKQFLLLPPKPGLFIMPLRLALSRALSGVDNRSRPEEKYYAQFIFPGRATPPIRAYRLIV